MNSGALGCAISGSGPSIFALSEGEETAESVKKAFNNVYSKTQIEFSSFVSKINNDGIKKIS